MKKLSAVGLLVLGLTSVIVVHEFGHFIFCKIFHIHTPIFSIGFGPTLIGHTFGDTFFQIALLPLGGYVAIDPVSLAGRPYIQKFLINIAGISFNLLCAFILLFILFLILSTRRTTSTIKRVEPNSPAQQAGLSAGDTIIAYNNHPLAASSENDSFAQFLQEIRLSGTGTITLTIMRNNTSQTIPVTLGSNHPVLGNNVRYLGIHLEDVIGPRASFFTVLSQSATYLTAALQQLVSITFGIFRGKNWEKLSGPIGIVTSLQHPEPYLFVNWLALININVAFFNILPFPFLDGGHLALDTIETIYGHPLPPSFMQLINLLFLFLFLWFMIHISLQDIKKLKRTQKTS